MVAGNRLCPETTKAAVPVRHPLLFMLRAYWPEESDSHDTIGTWTLLALAYFEFYCLAVIESGKTAAALDF